MSAVQIADVTSQQGQGYHGSFDRGITFNNMAAIGPDFKKAYVDNAPVSNADIAPTLAQLLGFRLPSKGKLHGRVLSEAIKGGPDAATSSRKVKRSREAEGKRTVMFYQKLKGRAYFDEACLIRTTSTQQASCH
jgi:arylsulfatase A-like enzyme